MNDITALMATMKAAAEKATEAHERLSAMPSDGLFDASLAENAQLESDITALITHNDASTPVNVRTLVEALEKAQKLATQQGNIACALFDEVTAQRQRIAELESGTVIVPQSDYFASLVAMARVSADKAMRKFPQPNYVLLKVAEEAGEVVQAGVHYAEKRMEWEQVEGEIVQLLAMLIRLVTEGDQINGITPPTAGIQVIEGEGQCGGDL